MWSTLRWSDDALHLLDQRKLPEVETEITCRSAGETAEAIRSMVVRGAPAIGVTAAHGVALSALEHASSGGSGADLARRMAEDLRLLRHARPTAVNLAWAMDRCEAVLSRGEALGASDLARRMVQEAAAIHEEDIATCRAIGRHGASVVPANARLLTHCNAGALATAGYGTALGVVRGAIEAGKKVAVIADETRPFLQGARLTAWELAKDGIPVTLIADVAAASLLRAGDVDLVVVGADRIAANGDVANKIGTYPLAVMAREHGVPFHVAAPLSTVDLFLAHGGLIPIEERGPEEVTSVFGIRVAPQGVAARNPAFDVTPAALVASIITEVGVLRAPYETSLREAFARRAAASQAGS